MATVAVPSEVAESRLQGSAVEVDGYQCLNFKTNSISFALKGYDPPKNLYSRGESRGVIKNRVLTSPRIKGMVREVAEISGTSTESVQAEAHNIFDEIAHKMALPAVRTVASLLRSVITKIVDTIYVNTKGLELLSRAVTEWPVVLLPSHRSYLDFILVSYVMFEHDIALPCIAAGQDFMSMRGVSPFLRRSGAFFLRRTFGSDRLYKAVFSEYVKTVLSSGDCPMEFFVEGTRSRTGKSLHPRLGLLSMVIEPYLNGCLPDILMVPISISYERTLEEFLFARELLGVPKPKESTTALFRARSILSENYGSIFVHIGAPISLHRICQDFGISRIPHTLLPREKAGLLPDDWKVVQTLGDIVLESIHSGMKIFPTSLVATAILQRPRGLQFDELIDVVRWMQQQVAKQGGQVENLNKDCREMASSGLNRLRDSVHVSSGNLITVATPEGLLSCEQTIEAPSIARVLCSQMDATCFNQLSEAAMSYLHLAYYRNQLLHLFVKDSMLALCLTPESGYATVQEMYSAVHCALASEFILSRKSPTEVLSETVKQFLHKGFIHEAINSDGRRLLQVQTSHFGHMAFLRGLLLPFIGCVWVVCQHLVSLDGGVQSLGATVKAAQKLSAKSLRHGLLDSYEIMSLGMVKSSLSSLHQAGLTLQASNEFGTGKDRLVKVIKTEKLSSLTAILGAVLSPQFRSKL